MTLISFCFLRPIRIKVNPDSKISIWKPTVYHPKEGMSSSRTTDQDIVDDSDNEPDELQEHQASTETKEKIQEKEQKNHLRDPFSEEFKDADLVRIIAKSSAQYDARERFQERDEYGGHEEDVDVRNRCDSLMRTYERIDGIQNEDSQEVMRQKITKHRKRVYRRRKIRRMRRGETQTKKKSPRKTSKHDADKKWRKETLGSLTSRSAFKTDENSDDNAHESSDDESDYELAATFKQSHTLRGEISPRKTGAPTPLKKQAAEEAAEQDMTPEEMYQKAKCLEENERNFIDASKLYFQAGHRGHVEAFADLAYVLVHHKYSVPHPGTNHVVVKMDDDSNDVRNKYCREFYETASSRGSWHSKYRLKLHPFSHSSKADLFDDIIDAGEAAGKFYYLAVWRKYDNYINHRRVSEGEKHHAFKMLRSVAPHCDDAMKAVVEWIIPIRMIRGAPGKILDNITNREQVDISIQALIKISRSKKVSQLKGREQKLWWIKVYEHIKMNPWYANHDQKATIERLREIVQEINNLMIMKYIRRHQREQSLNELLQRLRDVPVDTDL